MTAAHSAQNYWEIIILAGLAGPTLPVGAETEVYNPSFVG